MAGHPSLKKEPFPPVSSPYPSLLMPKPRRSMPEVMFLLGNTETVIFLFSLVARLSQDSNIFRKLVIDG